MEGGPPGPPAWPPFTDMLKNLLPPAVAAVALACVLHAAGPQPATPAPTLRSAYADDFLIGVALDRETVEGRRLRAAEIAARQFSSLTAENDMKWQSVQPEPGRYDFKAADAYVEFGLRHRMTVIGHTLVWHHQTPAWVFLGDSGAPATREELLRRMRNHILAVAGRYRGRIKGWDVVNEAVSDGPEGLRDSPWRRIIGDDFIDHAFRFAREADPTAELYYNDYGLENPAKRERALALLRGLLKRGVPVDGVGIQGHYGLTHPPAAEVERTIDEFAALGLKVMITELDVDVLPSRGPVGVADLARRETAAPALDPYANGLPVTVEKRLADRYTELFGVFLRHRGHLTRVTFWGLDDGRSWLNSFPIAGRTNHPLLMDRELQPKPAFFAVLKAGRRPPP